MLYENHTANLLGLEDAIVKKVAHKLKKLVGVFLFRDPEACNIARSRIKLSHTDLHRFTEAQQMPNARNYYAAYEERYKTAHRLGVRWASGVATPLVLASLRKYGIGPERDLLELGCGEGRDAKAVLDGGYRLLATDLSGEAIAYCKRTMPEYADSFRILDFLSDALPERFDFIYAIAVVHMLVLDEDRQSFYRFIRAHLKPEGLALICTMGDGRTERQSDIRRAFEVQARAHPAGTMAVAATSCRTVSFPHFVRELEEQRFQIRETGLTGAPP